MFEVYQVQAKMGGLIVNDIVIAEDVEEASEDFKDKWGCLPVLSISKPEGWVVYGNSNCLRASRLGDWKSGKTSMTIDKRKCAFCESKSETRLLKNKVAIPICESCFYNINIQISFDKNWSM